MRYALRNQEKIRKKLGQGLLQIMIESLNDYFSFCEDPNDNIDQIVGEIYPTLMVNDLSNESRMIAFYVIGKTYDVYRLAFKEFQKC